MVSLTLVRHANALRDDPLLEDFDRPLSERGRLEAPLMAQRFARSGSPPDRLVSSPALRALSTAFLFADALGVAHSAVALEPGIYEASAAELLEIVRGLDDGDAHVALFGHNPGLSDLCHALARVDFVEMPTCAVARFEFDAPRWSSLQPGSGRLMAFSFPKQRE